MAISQRKARRKPTGALYREFRKKKKYELGREPTMTKIGKRKIKSLRVLGGNYKHLILNAEFVNVMKEGKCSKVKIKNVIESPSNRHFVRRNIITKGAVVDTDLGKVKITSRPGQEGALNGVLI